MTSRDEPDWPEGFVDALRRHAARPPALTAAVAARRVRLELTPRSPARLGRWLPPMAAATAVIVALASASHIRREAEPPPTPRPRVTEHHPVVVGPLPENIVLWWADPETPVYFIVAPPSNPTGGQS